MLPHQQIELLARWPPEDRLRWMLQDGATGPALTALLNHDCPAPNARNQIGEVEWFACTFPGEALNGRVVFDPYCDPCFERFVSYLRSP